MRHPTAAKIVKISRILKHRPRLLRMKKTLLGLALTLTALPALAAIQYDYTQKSSTDGARLFFVDPAKRWYTEFNAAGAVTAIGANNIKIENLRSDNKDLGDGPVMAGAPTRHFQLAIDYDVTLIMKQIPLKQSVHTVIDSYTTSKFGDLSLHILANGVRTGNSEIDQLLDLETTKMSGFPLKQTVSIRMTLQTRAVNSQLKLTPTQTVVREVQVTAIRELEPKATDFSIPAGFTRADASERPRTR